MIMSHDLTAAEWRTSSRSGGSGQCVEVATNLSGIVAVRHSKRPDAEVIIYTEAEWDAFIGGAKDGEFDL
jgi:hypothetical protein